MHIRMDVVKMLFDHKRIKFKPAYSLKSQFLIHHALGKMIGHCHYLFSKQTV